MVYYFSSLHPQLLNPTEFFADIVIEHEYVECTASAIQALVLFNKLYPKHRKEEIENFITNAVHYLEDIQMPDGSWYVPQLVYLRTWSANQTHV